MKKEMKGGRRPGAVEPAPAPRRAPDPKDRLAARHAQLQKMMNELQEAEDAQVTLLDHTHIRIWKAPNISERVFKPICSGIVFFSTLFLRSAFSRQYLNINIFFLLLAKGHKLYVESVVAS